MNGQMKKGVLELCVLAMIAKEEVYGYEILKQITAHFPEVDTSTIYGILRRLLANNTISTRTVSVGNTPPRKYYRMTEEGICYFQEILEEWQGVMGAVQEIMGGKSGALL